MSSNQSSQSSINVISSTFKLSLSSPQEEISSVPATRLRRSHSVPILKINETEAEAARARIHVINTELTELRCDKNLSSLNICELNRVKQLEQREKSLIAEYTPFETSSKTVRTTRASETKTKLKTEFINPMPGDGYKVEDITFNDRHRIRKELRFGCAHYKRRAMFVTPCCNKFYKCRFCHDENESHHFDRKTLNELICSECNTRQKVQEACSNCETRFGKYTCLICNLFDDEDKKQYHCNACGICRIGGAENFFHCKVCNMCLPIQLKIDGHKCVENISRSHCPVCLGDIHTSRIPCHIPDCGHLLHKMCFDQLLASGHYACPICQTSLIDMTALWDFLDAQAKKMPMPKKYENQKIHIFCNDCQRTSKTNFHFIGLKCRECGAYNTTQDVKRRVSLVPDEKNTA